MIVSAIDGSFHLSLAIVFGHLIPFVLLGSDLVTYRRQTFHLVIWQAVDAYVFIVVREILYQCTILGRVHIHIS